MQKHKWLTEWSSLSMVNVCLKQNTMKNKRMGKILFFLSCNIYLSLCLYLQSFVMNVCVSTDWWWKESAPTAWLFRPSDLYSSHTHRSGSLRFTALLFENLENVLFEIICFAPSAHHGQPRPNKKKKTITDTWRQLKKNNFHIWWQDEMSFFWKTPCFLFFFFVNQLPAPFCLVDPNSLCSSNQFHF